jgi:hypothetical protein
MKKIALLGILVLSIFTFIDYNTGHSVFSGKSTPAQVKATNDQLLYKKILAEYSQKMRSVTPALINELTIQENSQTGMGKEGLLESEKQKLADILNEGTSKLSTLLSNRNGNTSYDDIAGQLYQVYNEEAEKISSSQNIQ